jgi:hypothetical protein
MTAMKRFDSSGRALGGQGIGGGERMITLRDPHNIQLEVFGGPIVEGIAAGRP